MNIKLTKARALEIQAKQVAHYAALYPEIDVADIVARNTRAHLLDDDVEYDVIDINHAIPRGAWIEMLIGKFQQQGE